MPLSTPPSASELTQLSAIMRAIALGRKSAAPALRAMAAGYEVQAAGQMVLDAPRA